MYRMMRVVLLLLCTILFHFSLAIAGEETPDYEYETFFNDSEIQDIRLRNSAYGDHAGRVEVMYNGTWGTICDTFWSFSDAQVACRMLGFSRAVCAVPNALFGQADLEVPIWMDNLQCRGTEKTLDQCRFSGWGENSCVHKDDGGVICFDEDLVAKPTGLTLLSATRKTLIIRFSAVQAPPGARVIRYRFRFQAEGASFSRSQVTPTTLHSTGPVLNYTITGLDPNTEYTVEMKMEFRYIDCFSYVGGNYSDPIKFRTNNSAPATNIPIRLIPPEAGLDFMGRLEVFHNNEWGTVCDDLFGTLQGNVVCGTLGYSRSACTVARGRLGVGSGPIWLDNVVCSRRAEVLDDCTFSPWGTHNCNHNDDVGVICVPDDYPSKINNVTITKVGATSVTLSWQPFTFPTTATTRRYSVGYRREGSSFTSRLIVSVTATSFTVNNLRFLTTYNFTVRAEVRFPFCFVTFQGVDSDPVTATPMENPPSGPPTSFHITVLSCDSIRAEWQLPTLNNRNGFIRGFKLFVQPATGGEETLFNITSNTTTEFIVEDLEPSTQYVVSVLAYTVGDGPRSIHLSVTTNSEDICQDDIITLFGINGDGLNRATRFESDTNIHILCGTTEDGVKLDWFFENGTKVGITNRNVREGHFENGTASLQIASDRRLSVCDSGVYACRANQSASGRIEQKTFKLTIGNRPPRPSRPKVEAITSTSVTISWEENQCTGGHVISDFNIRYAEPFAYYYYSNFFGDYTFIRGISGNQRNHTISKLRPSTTYEISVQAASVDATFSLYSLQRTVTTLPPAPQPPEDVSVVLVTPVILTVSWTIPHVSDGSIIFFTVYAIPLTQTSSPASRSKRQTSDTLETIAKNFTATQTTGNITLHEQSMTYHVQVSATVRSSGGIVRETDLSPITTESTVFVPLPGLPVPENVRVSSMSNYSVSLMWNYPSSDEPRDEVTHFKVSYSATIDGVSPMGTHIRFAHEGTVNTSANKLTVQPLTPQSSYIFKISAVTQRGQGQEIYVEADTSEVESELERHVYFFIRFGPVLSCIDFRSQDIEMKRELVKDQLIAILKEKCNCKISDLNIQNDAFGCGELNHLITYRGRILGTKDYSGLGLIELMQFWINTNQAYLTIDSFRMQIDPSCGTRLDVLNAPDCPTNNDGFPGATTKPPPSKPEPSSEKTSDVRPGEVGGIFVGVLIVILLFALIIVIIIAVLVHKKRKSKSTRNGTTVFQDEDKSPFAVMEPSTSESSLYDQKIRD